MERMEGCNDKQSIFSLSLFRFLTSQSLLCLGSNDISFHLFIPCVRSSAAIRASLSRTPSQFEAPSNLLLASPNPLPTGTQNPDLVVRHVEP